MYRSMCRKQALYDRAIADARSQPKEIHLAYLQCYALRDYDKDTCKQTIKWTIDGRKDASTWEYILPFDYEVERLGFKTFLQNQGKICSAVEQGPKYNSTIKAYDVLCKDGGQYAMRFDSAIGKWKLVE